MATGKDPEHKNLPNRAIGSILEAVFGLVHNDTWDLDVDWHFVEAMWGSGHHMDCEIDFVLSAGRFHVLDICFFLSVARTIRAPNAQLGSTRKMPVHEVLTCLIYSKARNALG